jgi:rubrerythrin
MTETVAEILSDDDVALLNEARTLLKALGTRASRASWDAPSRPDGAVATGADYGRVHALADSAEDAIFTVLNWTNSHHVRSLNEQQLHNRQECRDCGETFPYDPDADRCPSCVAANSEPPCGDPRPDPRTHPEYWTE